MGETLMSDAAGLEGEITDIVAYRDGLMIACPKPMFRALE